MQNLISIKNQDIALLMAPDFGARIVRLVDIQTGRDWLIPGDLPGNEAEKSTYGKNQACGWDECFPTVSACNGIGVWPAELRDHGDLWGRPWSCKVTEDEVEAIYTTPVFTFIRNVRLKERSLYLAYSAKNNGSESLPYLWSQHCLLKTGCQDRISLSGVGKMNTTYCRCDGEDLSLDAFDWPLAGSVGPDLQKAHDESANFALKAYAPIDQEKIIAEVNGPDGGIRFEWLQIEIPFVGLWLDYGGWPPDDPVCQIAIEPTTAPADNLVQAIDKGHAPVLEPGETHQWTARVTLLAA